ncbi:hypothetical protein GCM10009122_37600 [Fulvivirga kasyanovii]
MAIFNNPFKSNKPSPDFNITKPSQVAGIFNWVLNENEEVARRAAATVHRVLKAETSFKRKGLYNSFKYINLQPDDLQLFERFESHIALSLYAIASMNGNGYVREAAVQKLSSIPESSTFPFILFRLGDWVPAVRAQAENSVRKLIEEAKPSFFIEHHKIIDWLIHVERVDLGAIHEEISQFLFSAKNINELLQTIDEYPEGSRYYLFKNLVNRQLLTPSIVELILNDSSYLIRLLAVKNSDIMDNPALVKKLLSDKNQKIRIYAINSIQIGQEQLYKKALYHSIFDSSFLVRSKARDLISRMEEVNFYKLYQDRINQQPSIGAIIGLAETGSKADIPKLEMFMLSETSKYRSASLFALSILDFDTAKSKAFELLEDSSNMVKKMCANIITSSRSARDLPRLRPIFDSGDHDTKRYVLKIISQYGGWSVAGDFLKGIQEPNEMLKYMAYACLKSWYVYSMRLATTMNESDKQYVLDVYNQIDVESLELPHDIYGIVGRVPFIFDF